MSNMGVDGLGRMGPMQSARSASPTGSEDSGVASEVDSRVQDLAQNVFAQKSGANQSNLSSTPSISDVTMQSARSANVNKTLIDNHIAQGEFQQAAEIAFDTPSITVDVLAKALDPKTGPALAIAMHTEAQSRGVSYTELLSDCMEKHANIDTTKGLHYNADMKAAIVKAYEALDNSSAVLQLKSQKVGTRECWDIKHALNSSMHVVRQMGYWREELKDTPGGEQAVAKFQPEHTRVGDIEQFALHLKNKYPSVVALVSPRMQKEVSSYAEQAQERETKVANSKADPWDIKRALDESPQVETQMRQWELAIQDLREGKDAVAAFHQEVSGLGKIEQFALHLKNNYPTIFEAIKIGTLPEDAISKTPTDQIGFSFRSKEILFCIEQAEKRYPPKKD